MNFYYELLEDNTLLL